jgi:alpha-ribazole phosphatase
VTTILLARHGETDWNRDGRFQGHADPPLNAAGRRQAEGLAQTVASEPPDAVYASDLRRAFETAEIVGARLGLPVGREIALREIDVGSWHGLTREQIDGREWDGET